MSKRRMPLLWHTRRIFLACILVLAAMGFLIDWLLCHSGFWQALVTALCPPLLATVFYHSQRSTHFLEQGLAGIRNASMLNAAVPILLGSIGFWLQEQGVCLGMYLSISFLICICISEATLQQREDDLLSAMLWNVAIFYGMAVFLEPHAGAAIAIGAMSFILFLRLCWFCPVRNTALFVGKHFLALTTALLFLTVFFGRVIGNTLDYRMDPNALAFWDLLKTAQWFGPAKNPSFGSTGYGHILLSLVSAFGWISLVPIALVTLVLLTTGMHLCMSFNRRLTTLSVGCYYLLTVRILGGLLLAMGFEPGTGVGFPFLSGGFLARVLDFTMAAILMQPLCPPPLDQLDANDPDFQALETEALIQLPCNMDGLAQLCRYVFNSPQKRIAWTLLFRDYLPLMDENTLRIMVLNADNLFHTDYFRNTYPHIFACAGNQSPENLPMENNTECYNNSFLDDDIFFSAAGNRLDRYHGNREKLLIPPFYRSIAFNAFQKNSKLMLVSVPETVRRICLSAFEYCCQLQKAELCEGLQEIGPFAFASSALQEVNLPEGLRLIEENAFAETRLGHIFIPGSVETISEGAFSDIPTLKTVVLYEGVRTIANDAFRNCPQLTEIHIPDTLTAIAPEAFWGCTGIRNVFASGEWKSKYPDLLRIITVSADSVIESAPHDASHPAD